MQARFSLHHFPLTGRLILGQVLRRLQPGPETLNVQLQVGPSVAEQGFNHEVVFAYLPIANVADSARARPAHDAERCLPRESAISEFRADEETKAFEIDSAWLSG